MYVERNLKKGVKLQEMGMTAVDYLLVKVGRILNKLLCQKKIKKKGKKLQKKKNE